MARGRRERAREEVGREGGILAMSTQYSM